MAKPCRNGLHVLRRPVGQRCARVPEPLDPDSLHASGIACRVPIPPEDVPADLTDPNMPAMAANAYSILFGNFARHYVTRDLVGIRFEASADYAFASDQVTFRALLRTDGKRVGLPL